MAGGMLHEAHAIASFGELGLAISMTVLADFPKWRGQLRARIGDPLDRSDLKIAARDAGWPYIISVTVIGFLSDYFRWSFWYGWPAISGLLGYLALLNLAKDRATIVLTAEHIPLIGFDASLDTGFSCLAAAVISFWLAALFSIVFAVAMRAVNREDEMTEG